ncbi:hypothetical protein ACFX1S_044649 [Malus domestica]
MGKGEANLHQQQPNHEGQSASGLICPGCSMVFNRIAKGLSFRCVFVLVLSLSVFLSGIFWILPHRATNSGFDATQAIKLSATVQAYFRLEKPVTDLVPHIGRLEYDINGEIGVPGTEVAILSMHQFPAHNWTDVVFGFLSDPINVPIVPVSLSVLRSSLVELFLKQSNLTLTTSIFGQPSTLEILKYPGGITVIPGQPASIWQLPEILFNFTLNNCIDDIVENFGELKEQLKFGLYLRPYENVYLQITNTMGSTTAAPVVVQASLMSEFGGFGPQRLRQLAQIITGSPTKNLGLDNSVFGKVKSISLSSYLKGTLSATPPTVSPAPTPEPSISPYLASPVYAPAPSPDIHHLSSAPSKVPAHPHPCPHQGSRIPPSSPPTSRSYPTVPPTYPPRIPPSSSPPSSQLSPHVSPAPVVSYAPSPEDKGIAQDLISPSPGPSLSSLAVGPLYKEIRLLQLSGVFIFLLFCWSRRFFEHLQRRAKKKSLQKEEIREKEGEIPDALRMGKSEANLQQQQQQRQTQEAQNSSGLICPRCSVVFRKIGKELSFRCVAVLILSFSILLSGIFWIPHYYANSSQFDAKEKIKLSATVQAYFRLEKPVMDLVPRIRRLEYDINGEIGVPGTKVAILSMHQFDASDLTDVVFGALSDPINVPIDPVYLSVLRSSLVDLFLKQYNLTLTASIFGQPSMFEILKYPGGITVIPVQSASIWQKPQILFNFTLNNSISDIVENFVELNEQLKFGLHLRPYEDVFLRMINIIGSTKAPPVVVQASLVSDVGVIVPERLKQLVQTITGSRAKNLGLNNTVFGKVKSISLSSYPKGAPVATSPTPSPAPSPEPTPSPAPSPEPTPSPAPSPESSISPYPASPVHSPEPSPHSHYLPPALSPDIHHLPPAPLPDIYLLPPAPSPDIRHLPLAPSPGIHLLSPAPSPEIHHLPPAPSPEIHHLPPAPSPEIHHLPPAPSKVPAHPRPCPYHGSRIPPISSPTSRSNPTAPPTYATNGSPYSPSLSPSSQLSPHVPHAPITFYASSPGNKGSAQDSISPSPSSSSSAGAFYKEIWLLEFSGLLIFHLLCWFG